MSGPGEGNGRGEEPREGSSVLSNLPRTRPQRASARRAAARSSAAAAAQEPGAANGSAPRSTTRKSSKPASTAGRSPRKPAAKAKAKTARRREPEAVPRQGYESVEERATGPVQPPGNAEFIGTAAEIVTELAKAGISGSERLVRDVLSRLGR